MISRNFNSMEHCHKLLEEHSRILPRVLHCYVKCTLFVDMINQMYEKDYSIGLTPKHPSSSSL